MNWIEETQMRLKYFLSNSWRYTLFVSTIPIILYLGMGLLYFLTLDLTCWPNVARGILTVVSIGCALSVTAHICYHALNVRETSIENIRHYLGWTKAEELVVNTWGTTMNETTPLEIILSENQNLDTNERTTNNSASDNQG